MNEFTTDEFEDYLNAEWCLHKGYYSLHHVRGFFSYLWDETSSGESLNTKYGPATLVEKSTDYDEGRRLQGIIFKIGDRHFKKYGFYDSWDTTTWDGVLVEVKPVQKVVTTYKTL